MAARYKVLQSSDHADSFSEKDAFALDVLVGLSSKPKSIPSKYFYDSHGSELFRQICLQPEYYLTERESEIIEHHHSSIAAYAGRGPLNLVELGPGFSRKSILLLEHFASAGVAVQYVPIDISESAMVALVNSLEETLPQLEVNGLVTDYFNGLKWLNHRYRRKNLVLFLGSSIGNFTHRGACFFLRNLWNCLNHEDVVLIGFDLKKDIDLLLRAYNDSKGVTREFNLNLLRRINRELGGNFDDSKFRHFGTYNVSTGAMESYLVSQERQAVFIEAIGRSFLFEPWEPLHTEYSYKYLASDIEQLAGETGFEVHQHIHDSKDFFVDSLWRVQKRGSAEPIAHQRRAAVGAAMTYR
jgi:L-histidine N-alpha-methyltransferase